MGSNLTLIVSSPNPDGSPWVSSSLFNCLLFIPVTERMRDEGKKGVRCLLKCLWLCRWRKQNKRFLGIFPTDKRCVSHFYWNTNHLHSKDQGLGPKVLASIFFFLFFSKLGANKKMHLVNMRWCRNVYVSVLMCAVQRKMEISQPGPTKTHWEILPKGRPICVCFTFKQGNLFHKALNNSRLPTTKVKETVADLCSSVSWFLMSPK